MMNPSEKPNVAMSTESMGHNMRQIMTFRSMVFIVGGVVCGILGLTGLLGLIFYLLVGILGAVALWLKMGFDSRRYTGIGGPGFLLSDLLNFNHILSFILFWTLAYALVFIY